MTQFAADDFAYIAAKQRELAAQETVTNKHYLQCSNPKCDCAWVSLTAVSACPKCGQVYDPPLDMDAANEPADFSTENMLIKCREARPINCVMCNATWSGFDTDNCPGCGAKDPEIPF